MHTGSAGEVFFLFFFKELGLGCCRFYSMKVSVCFGWAGNMGCWLVGICLETNSAVGSGREVSSQRPAAYHQGWGWQLTKAHSWVLEERQWRYIARVWCKEWCAEAGTLL